MPLANRLKATRSTDDVVIVANLSDASRRIACQRLVSGIGDELGVDLLGDGWADLTATVKTQHAHRSPARSPRLLPTPLKVPPSQAANHF